MKTYSRINVGCGRPPIRTWINFDNSPSVLLARLPFIPGFALNEEQLGYVRFLKSNKVRYCDVTKGIPLETASAEVLYSSHMLEHLDRNERSLFLREVRRVLIPSGIVGIVVPDLRRKLEDYLDDKDADRFMHSTLLWEDRPKGLKAKLSFLLTGPRKHLWMYDSTSLAKLLSAHGFRDPVALEPGQTAISNPEPLNLSEQAGESIYVEARAP
jgi:hypothetical protein